MTSPPIVTMSVFVPKVPLGVGALKALTLSSVVS